MESIIKQKLIPDVVKDEYKSHENILIQTEVTSNEPQVFFYYYYLLILFYLFSTFYNLY